MLRLASLGSGSKGNATLVATDHTCLLVDCGFSLREAERRLQRLGLDASELTAALVTHEHSDHIKGVGSLARKHELPVYCSFGTRHAVAGSRHSLENVDWREVRPGREFKAGDVRVDPVAVPHDAREPCQYIFKHDAHRIGILTDTGSITRHLVECYSGCHALLLECNHDAEMLANGPYPPALKRRVGGDYGHLNNQQSADFLGELQDTRLQHLLLSHLSEKNNTPELALAAIGPIIGQDNIKVLDQDTGCDWLAVT